MVTNKQKRLSKATIDHANHVAIVAIAEANGIALVQQSNGYWRGVEHDSLVINDKKNLFRWNSRDVGGGALDFVQHYLGISSFREAVAYLNHAALERAETITHKVREPFQYNFKNSPNFEQATKYLTTVRKLDPQIVDLLHRKGFIQQDEHSNAIFVWSRNDKIVGATVQGTRIDHEHLGKRGTFKQIAKNSQENFGFNLSLGKPERLLMFEAPIDALSYWSLHRGLNHVTLMSMDGLKSNTVKQGLIYFCEKTGHAPSEIAFGVDNDPSGHVFYDQMRAEHALASVPYTSLIPADQAIPHECLAPVVSAAKQAAIPTVALMAYLKVAVNLQPGHGIANGYHYQDTLTKGSFADLPEIATQLKPYLQSNGIDWQAYFKQHAPDLTSTDRNNLVGRIKGVARQYQKGDFQVVQDVPKDWNDRLQIHERSKSKGLTLDKKIAAAKERAVTANLRIAPKHHDQALER
ncbi:LtrC-like protein [Lacticaseibacillus casei]|nr:LtrC-like protein [Lacticaseibacillus casei]